MSAGTEPSRWTRVAQRVRHAWPATALVHACKLLLAAAVAVPALESLADSTLRVDPATAQWIALLRVGAELPALLPRYAPAPLAAAVLLAPWLALTWLRALDRPARLGEHLREARQRYRQSAALWLATGLYLAFVAVAAALAISLLRRLVSGFHDERLSDVAALLTAAAFALAAVHALCVQDAATAALLRDGTSARQALFAGVRRVTPSLTLVRVICLGLQALAIPASLAVARLLWVGQTADVAAWLLGQAAALLATLVRAAWLALVLEPRVGSSVALSH